MHWDGAVSLDVTSMGNLLSVTFTLTAQMDDARGDLAYI